MDRVVSVSFCNDRSVLVRIKFLINKKLGSMAFFLTLFDKICLKSDFINFL